MAGAKENELTTSQENYAVQNIVVVIPALIALNTNTWSRTSTYTETTRLGINPAQRNDNVSAYSSSTFANNDEMDEIFSVKKLKKN